MPWNGADFAGARLWDLRDGYLGDETFLVELGSYEGPHINIATKDDSHVRLGNGSETIQRRRPHAAAARVKPNCGNAYDDNRIAATSRPMNRRPRNDIAEEVEVIFYLARVRPPVFKMFGKYRQFTGIELLSRRNINFWHALQIRQSAPAFSDDRDVHGNRFFMA